MNPLTRPIALLALLTLFLTVVPARAENGVILTSTILRKVEVVNEQGEKVVDLVPVDKAFPGEELIIRITYTNNGAEPARNILIVNPVPDEMSYVAGSAVGDLTIATFSIDSGDSFDLPEKLLVSDDEGRTGPAPPELYTHVRFRRIEPLAPGRNDHVSFKAVLK